MKVRVVYKPDGTVAVCHYKEGSGLTFEEFCEKAARACALVGLPYDDTISSMLPATRKYREAWRGQKGIGIVIDQEMKAKIDARASEEEQKQIALAERIVSLKAARNELTGDAALACQREIERLSQELADA